MDHQGYRDLSRKSPPLLSNLNTKHSCVLNLVYFHQGVRGFLRLISPPSILKITLEEYSSDLQKESYYFTV